MNCPRCEKTLEARVDAGTEVDVCPGCQGVWFDRGETETVTRPGALSKEVIERVSGLDALTAVDDSPPLRCPKCGERMQRERYAESLVEIDRCDCGVWADAGEPEKIAAYRARCLESLGKAQASDEGDDDGLDFSFAPEDLERSFARIYLRLGRSE